MYSPMSCHCSGEALGQHLPKSQRAAAICLAAPARWRFSTSHDEEIDEVLSDLPTEVKTADDVDRLLSETFEEEVLPEADAAPEV